MSNNTGNTLLALVTGAAIGAGLGVLFAPDQGKKTRKKIKKTVEDQSKELKDKVVDLTQQLSDKAKHAKVSLEDRVEHLVSDGSHKAEEVIDILEKKLADLKAANAKLQK